MEYNSINLSKDKLKAHERSVVSARTYNAVLGSTILYGIVANIIQCTYFSHHPISVYSYNKILWGYVVLSILAVIINAFAESALMRFLAYNMLALPFGVALSCLLQERGLTVETVNHAFTLTGVIAFCMISISFIKPDLFAGLGKILFVSLIGILIASIISIFIGGITAVDYFAAIVFSAFK